MLNVSLLTLTRWLWWQGWYCPARWVCHLYVFLYGQTLQWIMYTWRSTVKLVEKYVSEFEEQFFCSWKMIVGFFTFAFCTRTSTVHTILRLLSHNSQAIMNLLRCCQSHFTHFLLRQFLLLILKMSFKIEKACCLMEEHFFASEVL